MYYSRAITELANGGFEPPSLNPPLVRHWWQLSLVIGLLRVRMFLVA